VVIICQLPSSNTLIEEEKAMSASKDSGKLYHDFVIAVMGHMPLQHEITDRAMQRWLRDPKRLKAALHRVLLSEQHINPDAAKKSITEVFTKERVANTPPGFNKSYATRICKAAELEGWDTLGDLIQPPKELKRTPGWDDRTVFVIQTILALYGMELPAD
jgi:hypothetical protein